MAEHSSIEWTDATWNPVTGCSVVSPGCTNCYAMKLAGTRLKYHWSRIGLTRDSKAGPVWTGEVRFNAEWLTQPLQWKRPRKIFVCAHGDLFADGVPDAWIDQVFAVMALAPWHTFQVLTKRAARMQAYLATGDTVARIGAAQSEIDPEVSCYDNVGQDAVWPLRNVWLGVSAEDQRRADERIPDLMRAPAAVRFVSVEPALGPMDLSRWTTDPANFLDYCDAVGGPQASVFMLDWIIVGGESGPGARPMRPEWARTVRDQCAAAGVPFHFKQWGEWHADALASTEVRTGLCPPPNMRIGKKAAGRLLDGVEHNGMPRKAA